MKKIKFIAVLVLSASFQPAFSQKNLRVIEADSVIVNIRDGEEFREAWWTISPKINPDVYQANNKNVTFYTDKDSISVKVKPGKQYDFIILLNGKDSAYTRIERLEPYLDKLKGAARYNYKDDRPVPKFVYQSADDPELVRVREELKLDSIAGTGSDISKMINLMYWVHATVRHDGNSYNPESRNAIDLIKICREENRGINCRMMATILNECYLAMGMKSRFVTCKPKETEFQECHVINMVYSETLQKWVWMDPTFCAYVMDENGELLGLGEVRERLIKGKTLILNPDANWNFENTQTKEYYLEQYMAKNLYRMECPLYSEYDVETIDTIDKWMYVELLPLDGIVQEPQQYLYEWNGIPCAYYKTNNPDIFWAKPE